MLVWMGISEWYSKDDMIVETIKSYIHAAQDKIVTRQYTTMVDDNNKRYLQIVEYSYTPYSALGKIEAENTKGSNFDKKV